MRLPTPKIKEAILHPDRDVREAAVFYFSRSCSPDPTIMPLAIKAFERLGLDAFEIYSFLESLVQTDETVAWLIKEIERVGPGQDERDTKYADALRAALRRADATVLKRHEAAIQEMKQLDNEPREVISDRIVLNSFTPDVLWNELIEFCEAQYETSETTDQEFEYVCSVVEALSRYPEKFADQVLAILSDKADDPGEWLEGLAVRLAGEMRLDAAIPSVVDRFEYVGDWVYEEAHRALAKIGTDAVVDEIDKRLAATDEDFRFAAASTLEDIHTDLSVQACLKFLDQEENERLRSSLLQSILMNFSSEGIEAARQHVLTTLKTPDSLEVRYALLVACKLMGNTFPEFDAWLEDSKSDTEFRRRWYKEHYLSPPNDEDEFEEDDLAGENEDFSDAADEPPPTIVRREERVGRNDPCPCGSGKKFKKCCYGKLRSKSDEDQFSTMTSNRPDRISQKFPIGTVALYGPDDRVTTKIVASVIQREGAEPILQRWVGSNIKDSPKVKRGIKEFLDRHRVKSVAISDGNMGCPHEEGEDFPTGEDCPFCPYWAGKQGSGR